MKFLLAMVLAVGLSALILSGSCDGPTRWKKNIELEIDISSIFSAAEETSEETWLTGADLRALKKWADLLREGDGRAFGEEGGEAELVRRAREGKINMVVIDQILSSEPFDKEMYESYTKEIFDRASHSNRIAHSIYNRDMRSRWHFNFALIYSITKGNI